MKKGRAGEVAVEYSVYTAVSGAEHSRTNIYIPESIATYTHAEEQTSVCGVWCGDAVAKCCRARQAHKRQAHTTREEAHRGAETRAQARAHAHTRRARKKHLCTCMHSCGSMVRSRFDRPTAPNLGLG